MLLEGKPQEKGLLVRPRRRRVYDIKMNCREIVWDGMDWAGLADNRAKWRALVN
jgi:hypothetical protein